MVIYGQIGGKEKSIYDVIVNEKESIEVGVQLIVSVVELGEEKTYFYSRKMDTISSKTLRSEVLEDEKILLKTVKAINDDFVKQIIHEVNTQKVVYVQGRGIKTDFVDEVQSYTKLA